MNQAPSWLGAPESDRLELKSADALAHPETIVRAVVSLLNHRGGYVVIGVADDGKPEGRQDLDPDRLQSLLIDSIEPRPVGYANVQRLEVAGSQVLEVEVRKARKHPVFAERRKGMYGFWYRAGSTTRSLSLEEVRERLEPKQERKPTHVRWDKPLIERGEIDCVFVLCAWTDQSLDQDALARVLSKNEEERRRIATRPMSWSVIDEYDDVAGPRGGVYTSGHRGGRKWLTCDARHGDIRFEGGPDFLRWSAPSGIAEPVIYPFPIVEGTVSFLRLLKRYAEEARAEGSVTCQLGLWAPRGWRLGPHRPDSIAWQWPAAHWTGPHDERNVESEEREINWEDIRTNPDGVSHSFVTYLYEDFGYTASQVPFWLDVERRFVFDT